MNRVGILGRLLAALAVGAAVTFTVFFLMQQLIASGTTALDEDSERYTVDFVRVQEQDQVKEKEREKPEPPEPPEEPPEPETPQQTQQQASTGGGSLNISDVAMDSGLDIGAGISGGGDSEYLPIVKVEPNYPQRALRRGIEGYVVVEFTVTKRGNVENPRVVEADPQGVFDEAAKEAAKKFKYRPKTVNGEAVEVAGVRNIIRFEMEDGR
ncbi:energy transducer TonB [Halovibrio salipaludis]|uniref:energy transducer TonB n=1 Tax=Halovibrio salipaludis TaxID=2032626 RepID=UPI0018E9BE62|nr:energy transducer TonB [Halovibrio salipaludis]